MGGPKLEPTKGIATWEEQTGREQVGFAGAERAKGLALQEPLIKRATALSSGDPAAVLQAAAPLITPLTKGYGAAKENIFSAIAPGGARESALAGLEREKATGIAGALGGAAWEAPKELAGLGAGLQAFSLQELGAGLSSGQLAQQGYSNVMQAESAKKAATMGFLGDLVGAAGGMAGGYLSRPSTPASPKKGWATE